MRARLVGLAMALTALVAPAGAQALPKGVTKLKLPSTTLSQSDADAFAASPDGKTLYIAYFNGDGILSVPLGSPGSAQPLPATIEQPSGIAIAPDGRLMYVSSYTSNVVDIVDIAPGSGYGTVVGTIDPGAYRLEETQGLAVSRVGVLYIADSQTQQVLVADVSGDAQNDKVIGALSDPHGLLKRPVGLALSPNGHTLYITTQKLGLAIANVSAGLTNPSGQLVTTAVSIGRGRDGRAYGLTISADGRTLYLTPRVPETKVLALSTGTHRVIDTAAGFNNLAGLGFAGGRLYTNDGTVVSFRAAPRGEAPWAPPI